VAQGSNPNSRERERQRERSKLPLKQFASKRLKHTHQKAGQCPTQFPNHMATDFSFLCSTPRAFHCWLTCHFHLIHLAIKNSWHLWASGFNPQNLTIMLLMHKISCVGVTCYVHQAPSGMVLFHRRQPTNEWNSNSKSDSYRGKPKSGVPIYTVGSTRKKKQKRECIEPSVLYHLQVSQGFNQPKGALWPSQEESTLTHLNQDRLVLPTHSTLPPAIKT
jgi:hypothetical protein